MARTLGIMSPFDPSNPESRSLDPNIPWFFLENDLPPNPLGEPRDGKPKKLQRGRCQASAERGVNFSPEN